MKKKRTSIALFAFLLLPIVVFAQEEKEYDNPGYYVSYGMAGLYGTRPDYTNNGHKDGGTGGGGFIYYNLINKIGGNLALGISADYAEGKFNKDSLSLKYRITPTAFNIAYMTASDFLNFWAGLAVTYTFFSCEIKNGGTIPDQNPGVIGGDAFAGIEYIFTENKKFGAFFEFRFSLTDNVRINMDSETGEKINFTRTRYSLGVSYHF